MRLPFLNLPTYQLQKRDQSGTKPPYHAKGAGPNQSNPLIFMVLPARFERTAYRLGGDFNAFT